MFGYRKARRIVLNATQVFTEAFPQPPPSLTNVQADAATTYDEVDHILGLASEAVTDGNHISKLNSTFPPQVFVSSDKRPYRNLTFHNVSARQGSSYCNRARLNFQAFALRDIKMATREGCRVSEKMSYHFSFR